jgi:DNA-binding XRE family transcriptional regulator
MGCRRNSPRFGHHLPAARIRRVLTQSQVAAILGVTKLTVWNWEDCRDQPGNHQCARPIEFIGYDPFPTGPSLAERMVAFGRRGSERKTRRCSAGSIPQADLANLGCSPAKGMARPVTAERFQMSVRRMNMT